MIVESRTTEATAVEALEGAIERQPKIAQLSNQVLQGADIMEHLLEEQFAGKGSLFPMDYLGIFATDAYKQSSVATWYAILKNGIEHGDTLEYSDM